MPSVSCPCCGEPVRIPTVTLPADASLGCPWCEAILPVSAWQVRLAPLATIFSADGCVIQPEALQPGTAQPLAMAAALDRDAPSIHQPSLIEETPAAISEHIADDNDPNEWESTVDLDANLSNTTELHDDSALDSDSESDESSALSGISLVSLDEDELPGDSSLSQPSIEDVEQAWESRDGWDAPDSISKPAALEQDFDDNKFDDDEFETDDYDEDEFNQTDFVGSDSQHSPMEPGQRVQRSQVSLAEEQSPLFHRHLWVRKRRSFIRLLKIAAPTLVALPVIATIIYFAGVNLGLFAGDQSLASTTQQIESLVDPSNSHRTTTNLATENEIPVGAERLAADGRAAGNVAGSNPTASTSKSQTSDPRDKIAADSEVDSAAGNVDQLLRDLSQRAEPDSDSNIASDPATASNTKSAHMIEPEAAMTVEKIAREQWLKRNPPVDRNASEREIDLLNSATLAFPVDPPSFDAVLQASAEAEPDPELAPFSPANSTAVESIVETLTIELQVPQVVSDETIETAAIETAAIETAAIDTAAIETAAIETAAIETAATESSAISDVAKGDAEMIAACEQAMLLLNDLTSHQQDTDQDSEPASETILARLRAYRAVAEVGSLGLDPESSCIHALLRKLAEPAIQSQLEPLCSEWIHWRGRKTDGMLLIGNLQHADNGTNAEMAIEFSDQSKISIRFHDEISDKFLSSNGVKYMALGKIIQEDGEVIVQVDAAIELQ